MDFWVNRSKVKVTGALNGSMISADYLGYYISQSLHIGHIEWL
jgi:hypothetical protein